MMNNSLEEFLRKWLALFSQKGLSFARCKSSAQNFGHNSLCPKRFFHQEKMMRKPD
jgi:hypothetical protein